MPLSLFVLAFNHLSVFVVVALIEQPLPLCFLFLKMLLCGFLLFIDKGQATSFLENVFNT